MADLFWQYQELTDVQAFVTGFKNYVKSYELPNMNDVDTTYGYGLDIIGKIIGIDKRPVLVNIEGFAWNQSNWNEEKWNESAVSQTSEQKLSDGNFRKLLKMRQTQLIQARTYDNLLKLLDDTFPNMIYNYTFLVNEVTINYDDSSISEGEEVILTGDYILMPQGSKLITTPI